MGKLSDDIQAVVSSDLVAPYQTHSRSYVYEGSSNHILQVSDQLCEFWRWRRSQLKSSNKPPNQRAALPQQDNALFDQAVDLCREKKAFLYPQFPSLSFPCGRDQIEQRLSRNIKQLTLNVSESCNLNCHYCTYSGNYRAQRSHGRAEMSWSIAKQAIDFFNARCGGVTDPAITFYGGEPLIAFDLIADCVNYAGSLNWQQKPLFNITTNGLLLNKATIKYLHDNDFYLLVSLDGPEAIHDAYRKTLGERGSFSLIIDNLRRAQKNFPDYFTHNISFNAVLHGPADVREVAALFESAEFKENRVQISGIETAFLVSGVDAPWLSEPITGFTELRNSFVDKVCDGETPSYFLKAMYEPLLLRIHKRDLSRISTEHHYPNAICLPGERKILVDGDGRIHPCEKVAWNTIIGDVENGFDINAIASMIDFYISGSSEECRHCWTARLCSLCFAPCWNSGFDPVEKRKRCVSERAAILDSLKLYCKILERNEKALDYFQHYSIS